jgi:Cellulase (glycosyl hydrolase family 5)
LTRILRSRPSRRASGLLAALLLCSGAIALHAGKARADHAQSTIFDPPGNQLTGATPLHRNDMLDQIAATGSDTVRLLVYWRGYPPAPDDTDKPAGFDSADPEDYPPHAFDSLDASVRGITERGMKVLMTPTTPVPRWASAGGRKGLNRPDPVEFGRFVHALGERYSGDCYCGNREALPRVDFWSVLNEPNLFLFLHPQFVHGRSVSGALYRGLFLSAQRALDASGHGRDPLLLGETAPSPGTMSTTPLQFLRDVFCLDRSYKRVRHCAPIEAAGWAQHPYLPGIPPWVVPAQRNYIAVGSISRLTRALQRAYRAGATTTRLPVWITEFGVESYPEPSNRFGVPPLRQAEFIGISEYLLWRNPQVDAFGQYLLTDDPGRYNYLAFQTGLRWADGKAKPAYSSFPMTLVARRIGSGDVVLWGHVRPGSGVRQVDLSYRDGADQPDHTLATAYTDNHGYFDLVVPNREGREFRAFTVSAGRVLEGPFIRSYRFPVD